MDEVIRITNARQSFRLIRKTEEDCDFIGELFNYKDVRKNYPRSKEHEYNLSDYVKFLAESNQKSGLYFIIEDKHLNPVGIITAEARYSFDIPTSEMAFAILPKYRNKGFATDAVINMLAVLRNTVVKQVYLDFSMKNEYVEKIAKKCGFSVFRASMSDLQQLGGNGPVFVSPWAQMAGIDKGNVAFFDEDNPEADMRQMWMRPVHMLSQRDMFGDRAIEEYRNKNYIEAIRLMRKALEIPFTPGSVHDDGALLANLGMAYSSIGRYHDAYEHLLAAREHGVDNPTVQKEIRWLEDKMKFI